MTNRVVLAYSGGLDTSVGIGWIAEETGAEVIAVAVDVGQGGEDLEEIRKRALACGAVEAVVADARDEFAEQYCLPALQANALYMDRYPLVSALSRPLIVKHLVRGREAARRHRPSPTAAPARATTRCASRSASRRLAPELTCIAPVRDFAWTREKAIAVRRGARPADRRPPSARRTRSTRTCGAAPSRPASWRTSGTARSRTSTPTPRTRPSRVRPTRCVIPFEKGVPVAIDGKPVSVLQAIQQLNARAGAQGVGRLDMVEDRLVGIKSREVYEAPGAIALITAHQELENVTVERDLARFKRHRRAALDRAGLRRPVVLPAQATRWTRSSRRPRSTSPARSG